MAMTDLLHHARRGLALVGAGLLGAGVLVPVALALPAAAHSIGVYPTQLAYADALRGANYEQTVGIVDDSPTPETFDLTVTGTIASWASFREASDPTKVVTTVQAQAGPPAQVLLRIDVPVQAGDDTYQGLVHATPEIHATKAGKGSGQSVDVSVEIPVSVQVTGTQVVAGTLLDAYTYPAIEVGSPLRFFTVLKNSGNVEVHPAIHLTITRGPTQIFDHVFQDEPVDPGLASKTIESDWSDTTAAPVGSYTAHVDVQYNGKEIGSKDAHFQVVPYGSLRRNGSLDGLLLANRPNPGQAALVHAVVQNTGQIETRPVFQGELYRNGQLISGVTSVPMLTLPGQTQTISMVINLPKGGHYTLRGQANFDGKESNTRSLAFQVGKSGGLGLLPWLLGGLLLVLAGSTIWLVGRRRRRTPPSGGAGPGKAGSTARHKADELTPLPVGFRDTDYAPAGFGRAEYASSEPASAEVDREESAASPSARRKHSRSRRHSIVPPLRPLGESPSS